MYSFTNVVISYLWISVTKVTSLWQHRHIILVMGILFLLSPIIILNKNKYNYLIMDIMNKHSSSTLIFSAYIGIIFSINKHSIIWWHESIQYSVMLNYSVNESISSSHSKTDPTIMSQKYVFWILYMVNPIGSMKPWVKLSCTICME